MTEVSVETNWEAQIEKMQFSSELHTFCLDLLTNAELLPTEKLKRWIKLSGRLVQLMNKLEEMHEDPPESHLKTVMLGASSAIYALKNQAILHSEKAGLINLNVFVMTQISQVKNT